MSKKRVLQFEKSFLLTTGENAQVKAIIGDRKESFATTVVQLYFSQNGHWQKVDTGVLCFIKDHQEKAYFFRLCCLERMAVIWEEEIYKDILYMSPKDFFHTFEGRECIVAFNFANGHEANHYKSAVYSIFSNGQDDMANGEKLLTIKKPKEKKKKEKTKKMTKKDREKRKATIVISDPINFQHVAHVGFGKGMNSMEGFNNTKDDDDVLEIFKRAGVSKNQLQDRKTREFMVDFVKRTAVERKSQKRRAPPPPPIQTAATLMTQHNFYQKPAPPTPPPPSQITHTDSTVKTLKLPVAPPLPLLPPKTARKTIPPSLPSVREAFIPPPPPPINFHSSSTVPQFEARPIQFIQKSPPPPSVKQGVIPPPPPLVNYPPNVPQIEPQPIQFIQKSPTQIMFPVEQMTDTRSALLESIRKGQQLKSVNARQMPQEEDEDDEKNDIAAALSKAIAMRERAIQNDTSDSETYNDSDEWDDD